MSVVVEVLWEQLPNDAEHPAMLSLVAVPRVGEKIGIGLESWTVESIVHRVAFPDGISPTARIIVRVRKESLS